MNSINKKQWTFCTHLAFILCTRYIHAVALKTEQLETWSHCPLEGMIPRAAAATMTPRPTTDTHTHTQ